MLEVAVLTICVLQNYSNCACIVQDLGRQLESGVTMTTVAASSGICRGECATLLPFMIMLFFMTFVIAGTQMPLLMVTIRWGLSGTTHTRLTALRSGLPGWAGTRKLKTNLDFTEARDSEWQWHQLGHMQVCTLLLTDNHASTLPLCFLQADALPAAKPTVQSTEGKALQRHYWWTNPKPPLWS